MFDSLIKKLTPPPGGGAENVAGREQRLRLATAVLLLEVAWTDDDLADSERAAVEKTLRERFELTPEETANLLETAEDRRRRNIDLYATTSVLRETLDRKELLEVVASLWRIVYADGVLEAHEDALLHKLSHLLGIDHSALIALKLRARDGDAR